MTAQDLKNSILQLAMQGKLVPQNPEDVSVDLSDLKLKKTDDYEFDIPNNWRQAHLETITTVVPSKQYQILESEVKQVGKFPVVSQSKSYSIGFTDNDEKVYCHENPVIIFGDHTTEIKFIDFDFVVGADGVKIFEPLDFVIIAKFLFYVLQFYSRDLNKVGGYSRHYKFIKNKPIPLPPLEEQKRIVAKIEELLPYVEEYDKSEKRLAGLNNEFPDKLRKSILQQAVQGKLTERHPDDEPASELLKRIREEKLKLISEGKMKKEKTLPPITDDEKTFEIPNTWEWARLDDVYSVGTGMTPLKSNRSFYENGTIPWITSSLTSNRYIDHAESYITEYALESNSLELYPENTLLIAMYGQGKTRGQISELLISATINQACAALVAFSKRDTLNQYIYFYFQYYYESLRKKAEGSSQPNLNLTKIRECVIPVPPLAEQKRIVARIEEIFAVCDKLE